MQIDKITFNDIAIFHAEEEFSIFNKLNFTRTVGGKEWLRQFFTEPHSTLPQIKGTQYLLKSLVNRLDEWPAEITNGTVIMMEKFLDYNLDPIDKHQNPVNSFIYRLLHSADYSMAKFSVKHFADFYRGIKNLSILLARIDLPPQFLLFKQRIDKLLTEEPLQKLANTKPDEKLTRRQNLYFAYHLEVDYKRDSLELMDIYSRFEAWYSMAVAVKTYNLHFPEFIESNQPYLKAEGLYHILLDKPVAYDLIMNPDQNFLFLTGANMAGKSTLIKSIGAAVFLAHMGMGVPVKEMKLSLFDGLLSNINVADNIARGESYFFNEVQRIKNTILKINDGKKWLVLIDELFKGTNVQDAMKCSLTVIEGFIKIQNSLFILSTHLYEIGEELKKHSNIAFKYFETDVADDQLKFSYQLKDGISNDRLGYVILKREKVVEMLQNL